jgi:hypothetical protein
MARPLSPRKTSHNFCNSHLLRITWFPVVVNDVCLFTTVSTPGVAVSILSLNQRGRIAVSLGCFLTDVQSVANPGLHAMEPAVKPKGVVIGSTVLSTKVWHKLDVIITSVTKSTPPTVLPLVGC